MPRLGAALAAADEPLVLVLDDLHLLHDRACLDAVATLARHVRDGSQLALSARGAPALPLGALRARGLELELGPEDLRMDTEQAGLLLRAAGVELPDAEVAELTAHTEGWSAGLYLAALSIRARGLKGKPAASFSGSDLLVSDYLQSELLAQLSADELRFLTRTSVLDRLSGPLCDAVLEESGSASTLESLARSNLFLVPLDPSGEWYRYHHLFQELLRSALSRAEPDLVPGLLARAADWCEAYGEPERAIGYAQQAGDVDRVARLVEQCVPPAYQSGRVTTAERWFEWLEARGALERNPLAAVLGSLLATLWGRPAEAERRAQAAELASHDGGPPDGSASMDSWLVLLRAHRCQRGVARMRADAELALELLAPGSRGRPHALLLLGVSRLLTGEIDQADDLFADAVEAGLELGTAEEVAVALGERAAIAVGRDAWVQAEELANQALASIRRSRMEDYPTSALVYAVAARVALRRGEAQRADELLSQGAAAPAPAHLRDAVDLGPDALGARPRLPHDGRRGRRRDDAPRARRAAAPATGPRHPPGRGAGAALEPADDARTGARGLDADRGGAPRAPLPRHASLLPRDRRAPVPVPPHREVTRDGHLPQAQRDLAQRRRRTRRRTRAALRRRRRPTPLMPSGR